MIEMEFWTRVLAIFLGFIAGFAVVGFILIILIKEYFKAMTNYRKELEEHDRTERRLSETERP